MPEFLISGRKIYEVNSIESISYLQQLTLNYSLSFALRLTNQSDSGVPPCLHLNIVIRTEK